MARRGRHRRFRRSHRVARDPGTIHGGFAKSATDQLCLRAGLPDSFPTPHQFTSANHRPRRLASSASSARSRSNSKNVDDWPMKSPIAVRNFSAPMAAPSVAVGRTIEHAGSFRLKNSVGSGMIRLVWNSSPPNGEELRSGNTSVESFGSVRAGAFPPYRSRSESALLQLDQY
jgi:hypothetical protein